MDRLAAEIMRDDRGGKPDQCGDNGLCGKYVYRITAKQFQSSYGGPGAKCGQYREGDARFGRRQQQDRRE
ncbi:hypothetical protein HMSSN036_05770 [Paenibacillus macerans]|nr:hypothetical protein HMSSN036_05770 [Paenibacillus macerans]